MSVFVITYKAYLKHGKETMHIYILFSTVVLLYGLSSVVKGDLSYYGITSIGTNSPSQSGIIYLLITVLSTTIFNSRTSKIIVILAGILCVVATLSRTSVFGLSVFFLSLLVQFSVKKFNSRFNSKSIYKVLYLLLFLSLFVMAMEIDLLGFRSTYLVKSLERFNGLSRSIEIRKNMSESYLSTIINGSAVNLTFGQGKAIPEIVFNRTTLGVDNQYTRLIIEGGIIGLILWTSMIFSWVKYFKKNVNSEIKIVINSFVLTYLAMGMGYEVFQASKSAVAFWLVMGTLSSNTIQKKA